MTPTKSKYLSRNTKWHKLNIFGKLQNIENDGSTSKIYIALKWQTHSFQGAMSKIFENRALNIVLKKLVRSHVRVVDSTE